MEKFLDDAVEQVIEMADRHLIDIPDEGTLEEARLIESVRTALRGIFSEFEK